MLEPLIKEQSVNSSEEAIAHLSESKFFSLWSYPNIYRDENISQKGSGHEMCDLFVVCGDTAIIISDKSHEFVIRRGLDVAWNSWYKKSIFSSAKQLFGCFSWMKQHPHRVFTDKHCTSKFPFSLTDIKKFHLIAITDDIKKDKDHVGQFSYDCNVINGKSSNTPFIIGNFDKKKPFVHVFNRSLFSLILENLNTITDFTSYLYSKEKSINNGIITHANCEEQILASFLKNRNDNNIVGHLRTSGEPYSFSDNTWMDYLNDNIQSLKFDGNLAFNKLLQLTTDSVVNANVGLGKDQLIEIHEIALRIIAQEPYISRKILSQVYLDKFNEVPKNVRSSRLCKSLYFNDLIYVFLFLPRNTSNLDEYRKQRFLLCSHYATVVKYQNPSVKRVMVIATEPKGYDIRSEDVVYFDCHEDFDEEDNKNANTISRTLNILTHVNNVESKGAHVFRGASRISKITPKFKRNALCFCGSGKKYKKCCLNK
ncbi:YecA family protein [Vibrio cincinnatiensis]